jgi:hypothetical protein
MKFIQSIIVHDIRLGLLENEDKLLASSYSHIDVALYELSMFN